MGRPLKIAKAQAVITLTATNGSTDVVTTSANLTNLGIIAGMPFIPGSNIGGLVAGTTYWILEVLSSTTFTVSATELSANPNYTKVNLSGAGPVTVAATVGVVDAYFNNPTGGDGYPATNANTYSVVGGNTNIYGTQVRVGVAIGRNGTGVIVTDDTSADVFGGNTDFANISGLAAGSAIQAADGTNLGFVSSIGGLVTEVVTDTEATGSFVVTSGDATNFTADKPVVFDGAIGGLQADTVYFVLSGANTTHFQVATSPGGAPFPVVDETTTVNASQDVLTLGASASASYASGTDWIFANDEAGFIVRQKGKQKYLVTGTTTGLTAPCYTANVANTALTPNTMTITATYANTSTTLVQSLSDHTLEIFGTGNVLPNSSPAYATFNTAYAADTYGGQPYPIVTITGA
jgi:hypothetical protein